MIMKVSSVSLPTIKRLPSYLHILRQALEEGHENISSAYIARALHLEAIQVRKDLSATGISGQSGVGFNIAGLIKHLEDFLGWNNSRDAFLVGCGNLGVALMGYEGFRERGLNIVAGFDVDKNKIGKEISGKKIFSLEKFPDLLERLHIKIGVLTVPQNRAQQVAGYMVESGIEAIWNFTSVRLDIPEHIIVERVELECSLAVLSSRLREKNEESAEEFSGANV
ncbi:Redox-sensing transcriptional repressor rex [Sedimentisphaera cyanobacteriorum]|uniref:Redox-sensing transcriptional repressor Rex n=1 Tax=Sedimentisphaera cyanobacteriorum TaxID=1940790 RepID=A0A1Q2HQC3_9BACT|nr:redox-sensing transcriptional repressor Rex [Sedimentisphaera cyanobacteriorum]AQQ09484.1 Redox-sensing transcriptional repressor rex [Sedimentisphaera cyanobacteriorum]